MFDTKLQTPIDAKVLKKAKAKAKAIGFSSINEAVRKFLQDLANNKVDFVMIYDKPKSLYRKQLDKEIHETMRDLKKGKVKTYSNAKDLLEDLIQ